MLTNVSEQGEGASAPITWEGEGGKYYSTNVWFASWRNLGKYKI